MGINWKCSVCNVVIDDSYWSDGEGKNTKATHFSVRTFIILSSLYSVSEVMSARKSGQQEPHVGWLSLFFKNYLFLYLWFFLCLSSCTPTTKRGKRSRITKLQNIPTHFHLGWVIIFWTAPVTSLMAIVCDLVWLLDEVYLVTPHILEEMLNFVDSSYLQQLTYLFVPWYYLLKMLLSLSLGCWLFAP